MPFLRPVPTSPTQSSCALCVTFFDNHALLGATGQHQWYTVDGGSQEYVHRLGTSMFSRGVDLRLNAPIEGVKRNPAGVEVKARGGDWEQFNEVVFATHSDDTLAEDANKSSDQIDLTYWMNSLQPWLQADPLMVTLNTTRDIDERLIWDEVSLRHPVYDLAAIAAQSRAAAMNGSNRTWFCGAWMKNGFHEDGLSSAYDVVTALNALDRVQVAAE